MYSDSESSEEYDFESQSTPRSQCRPSIVEDHDNVFIEITEEEQEKMLWYWHKFFEENPIDSVLDLEDEPTEFIRYKLKKNELLEVDK